MRNRGERRRLTRRYQMRQYENWLNHHYGESDYSPSCEQVGKWKNISWKDCGRPKCGVCSSARKNPNIKGKSKLTVQEVRNSLDYQESLDQL